MTFAHLTLATPHVDRTAAFFVDVFGWPRSDVPGNTPVAAQWLELGLGQTIHVLYVEGATVSAFEAEFGRHVAVFHPLADFPAIKARIVERGGVLIDPLRTTPFERFFFREPVNGYVFEVIEGD